MTEITLYIPRPPSANNLYANAVGRGRVKTSKYARWRSDAALLIRSQRPGTITGPFTLDIICPRPDRRRRDCDNLTKPTLDAIVSAGVTGDDSECVRVSAGWGDLDPKADMTVTVRTA